ncbi:MAG: hypothetical protein ACO3XO_10720 [Bdellovibrionota bacterium]|jgi:hypothetical protein
MNTNQHSSENLARENPATDLSTTSAPKPTVINPFNAIKSTYVGPSFGNEKGVRHAILRPQEVASQYANELTALEGEFVAAGRQIQKISEAETVQPKVALAVLRATIGSDSFVFSLSLLQATTPFRKESGPVVEKLVAQFEKGLSVISSKHGKALCAALEKSDDDDLAQSLTPVLRELSNYRERGIDFECCRLDSILDNCRVFAEVTTSPASPFRHIIGRWLQERKELKTVLDRAAHTLN